MNTKRKQQAHSRNLALAYLGARSAVEVRLDKIVDDHIERVIASTDGNISTAAALLGVNRRSLQRRQARRRPAR